MGWSRFTVAWSADCCESPFSRYIVYGGLLVLTYWQFDRAPTGFIPQQDKGYLLLNVQLAGLGIGRADDGRHESHRENRTRHAGR